VELADNCHGVHLTLKELMERKSKRDHINFTIYQLSKALNMPHSILLRLIHPNPAKRVNNPRIDTLTKIIDFFRADGFNVTIDNLLTGFETKTPIDVQTQEIGSFTIEKMLPLYSFETEQKKIGMVSIKLATKAKSIIALLSDEDIKPMFKKGSIFIIDTEMEPENDTLVAVKINSYNKVLIKKFYVDGNKRLLKSYNNSIKPIVLMPTMRYSIIGVVIQINAKT
jgi:hypothetical protein